LFHIEARLPLPSPKIVAIIIIILKTSISTTPNISLVHKHPLILSQQTTPFFWFWLLLFKAFIAAESSEFSSIECSSNTCIFLIEVLAVMQVVVLEVRVELFISAKG